MGRVGWLAGCLVAVWPTPSRAAPIEFVAQHGQFMVFDDVDGTVQSNAFFERDPFLAVYGDIEAGFLAAHPDDSQFLVVYSTWTLPGPVSALYQAVANDVTGIGYAQAAAFDPIIPAEVFDDTPNSQVQGFLHMNRWTQYLGGDPGGVDDQSISHIFGQELGHAWLAFVYVDHPMLPADAMLGRSDAHWSFYLHSAGSPVEGHDWTDNGDGTFTANKRTFFEFSDLDLYLMGLLPASDVDPWFMVTDASNCVDSALPDGSCAPSDGHLFAAESYTVDGTRVDITIDHVLAAEGTRAPAVGDAPTSYDVSFLLIKRPDEELSAMDITLIDAIVARSVEIFNEQTRGLATVVNRTAVEDPPDPTTSGSSTTGSDGSATAGPLTTAGSATTGSGTAGSASGGGSAGTDSGDGPDGSGGDGDASGCACRTEAPRSIDPWPWLAVLLFARDRRRRAAALARA